MSTILSRRDLDFLLYEWLDVEALTTRPRYAEHSRETFDGVLELSEQIATEHFAPHNRKSDLEEPRLVGDRVELIPEIEQALRVFARADLVGAAMDAEVGGMQLPHAVFGACMAWFHAANVATAGYPLLTVGNANLLLAHGSPEQVERYVKPMLEGRFFGTMALSEPQAGSSLADITTRALPQDDGSYRLFGNKMWISGAEHEMGENIVHLVLAKIPGGPAGTRGISLFVVPKFLVNDDGSLGERNDVVIAGLNHKMGFRGTVNTIPNLGEGGYRPGGQRGAVGYLVGEPHRGLSYMFHMMNEARIGIGLAATALGYTGYLKSVEYARSRPQGRPPSGKDPAAPQVPIIEHADVRRMLLAQKAYVEGALALNLYCGRLVDEEKTGPDPGRARLLLDVLTPIAKSWPSQWCLLANDLAIQVHGGYGYTRDYDVEQHYRDNRLNPIHEGTHGIQAQDLLGRKMLRDGGAGLRALVTEMASTAARAATAGGEAAAYGEQLAGACNRLVEVTTSLAGLGDPVVVLANASVYLEAAGHLVIAWIWLEQLLAVGDQQGDFYDGKRHAARFFYRWELPRTGPQLDLLAAVDRTPLDMRDAWF
jgi:butyryl-CoA dehydrogenase